MTYKDIAQDSHFVNTPTLSGDKLLIGEDRGLKTYCSGSEWHRVTRSDPCPICGKPDWCLVSNDGKVAICPRVQSERQAGDAGWMHYLSPDYIPRPLPAKRDIKETPRADPDTLNIVYSYLLNELTLQPNHEANLRQRGLGSRQIATNGYRTLPREGRPTLATKLTQKVHSGELPKLAGVPGFYMVMGKLSYPNLGGAVGMIIPVRDFKRRIIGLQVRCDGEVESGKYKWVSSVGQFGGCSPGAPVHIAKPRKNEDKKELWITEGPLKADIAATRLGRRVLGVAGVGNWRGCLGIVKHFKPDRVIVAYDMDKLANPNVKHYSRALSKELLNLGVKVFEAQWPKEYKGIDDLLTSQEFYVQQLAKLTTLGLWLLPLRHKSFKAKTARDKVCQKQMDFKGGRAWVAWAEYLRSRHIYRPFECLTYGTENFCPEGGEKVWDPVPCGDRYHCVVDGFRYEQSQTESAMARFNALAEKVPDLYVMRLVFTLPRELWGKVKWHGFGALNKLAIEAMSFVVGGQVAGVQNNQYWHTKNPLPDKYAWYPHLHSAYVNVVRCQDGSYKRIDPHLDHLKLKTAWTKKLARLYKLNYREHPKTGKPQLNVGGNWRSVNIRLCGFIAVNDDPYIYPRGYRKGKAARFTNRQYLKARLRYDFRLPQADLADYGDRSSLPRFNERQKLMVDVFLGYEGENERIGRPKNFRRERWVGWLGDGVAKKRLAELEITIPSIKERRKALKKELGVPACPIHGCQCLRQRAGFGYKKIAMWELEPGDVLLGLNYRNDGRYWIMSPELYNRWHTPRAPT